MKSYIYIPNSLRAAGRSLRRSFGKPLESQQKRDFLRAWCSIVYLYPGLHPDGYGDAGSGWPRALQRFAAEAWRRARAGEFTDNELYCYQVGKARLIREYGFMALEVSKKPWFFTDHFAT